MGNILKTWNKLSLVSRILIGLIVGILLAVTISDYVMGITILGTLFVGALKAVAPILVFFLIMSAISQHKSGHQTNMRSIIVLYLIGTFLASLIAVVASFLFPVSLKLAAGTDSITPPGGVVEVLKTLLLNVVDNPVRALYNANYIGVLSWSVLFGYALRGAPEGTKTLLSNLSDGVSIVVKWIINLAPLGIMGLVFEAIATNGLNALLGYGK